MSPKFTAILEILNERKELEKLGLSEEELDGYTDFYLDNYPELKEEDKKNDKDKYYIN